MCGVVSIIYNSHNDNLGNEGSFLLKKLEYRGYDSTGGAFMKEDGTVILKKRVGAPSVVTVELDMDKIRKYTVKLEETYGSVTNENAQPHEVKCHIHLVGAHNGNISNTDTLKEFLRENGHFVVSDNDGEMLVHLVEHFYAKEVNKMTSDEKKDRETRIKAFIKSIRDAQSRVVGSYAACITDPEIDCVFAMKSGSSLYAGKGSDAGGDFIVVSSDLTSILAKTRFLIPLSEGEGLYFTSNDYKVFSLSGNKEHIPNLTRSRLNVADIALQPKYHYFMEQEIFSSPKNLDLLMRYYFSEKIEKQFFDIFEEHLDECREQLYALLKLYEVFDIAELEKEFEIIRNSAVFTKIFGTILREFKDLDKAIQTTGFTSEDSSLLDEILGIDEKYFKELFILDKMLVWKKKRMILRFKDQLVNLMKDRVKDGGRIFVVASGTSYHAALTSAYFFNNLAKISIIPVIPGNFRSIFMNSVSDKDLIIGVSQSGETKDLVDIFNDLRATLGTKIKIISIVNNENSTLPQEKSDFYLPVMCGPEIAVAATKSFISQLALFYILAASFEMKEDAIKKNLEKIKYFMDFTLKNVDHDISEVSLRLFLKPSIHILGTSLSGLSLEGALKVREVVLNHTEGYDSAEFKHGPNTILGKNTIFSLQDMENLHANLIESFEEIFKKNCNAKNSEQNIFEFLDIIKNYKLKRIDDDILPGTYANDDEKERASEAFSYYRNNVSLEKYFSNYPLIFICPPDERDKRITITQIHTHKIRGADIILIAEDSEDLRKAVEGKPMGFDNYYNKYIRVPKSGDKNIFVFEAALTLQLLALKMSVAKMKYLNKNKAENHGVHPDVPKNVSKSITVD